MSQIIEVKVPDIGDLGEVDVIELLVKVGDTVSVDQGLITVESDKASMEIPSSHAGKVTALTVTLGDKVKLGSPILQLEVSQEASLPEEGGVGKVTPTEIMATATSEAITAKEEPSEASTAKEEPSEAITAKEEPSSKAVSTVVATPSDAPVRRESPTAAYALTGEDFRNLPHASPSVRRFARELGVDLSHVKGTGRKDRISADDVRAFVKAALSAPGGTATTASAMGGLAVLDWPKIDFTKFGAIESKPLSRIKKISGANLHRNWVMIPHVTNNDEADITDLEAFRVQLNKEHDKAGIKFTMLAFFIKAIVQCLKKFPEFNASLDGDHLILKQYYHIGFAADTPTGLVVPVIRDADKKSVSDIATETAELAKLAREGKLSPAQMQGGCFSISSLGGIGGTYFTPIINAPEVAILGVGRSYQKPIWDGKAFTPRLTVPLSLSYDHRVIDGALAARFNVYLTQLMGDFRRVLV